MKPSTLLRACCLLSAVALLSASAFADVGVIDMQITNKINMGQTLTTSGTAGVGCGVVVKIPKVDAVGFVMKLHGTNASDSAKITVTFARSGDGVNYETSPRFTWANAINDNTAVVGYTNVPNTVIGAAGYVKVVSIANASTAADATNCALYLITKTLKPSP